MAPVPGILFATSRISDDSLDGETFRKWYEDVHIPDVLATSGVDTAFRFKALDTEQAERPYLALYLFRDLEWLSTGEYFKVPLTSDLLPNQSKHISDVADFDMRFYQTLRSEDGSGSQGKRGEYRQ